VVTRWVGVGLALVALALMLSPVAAGQATTDCPTPPADFEPPLPNDAAIETRSLRQDEAQSCEALSQRLDYLAEFEDDVRRFGGWTVGVLLATLIAVPLFGRIVRSGG